MEYALMRMIICVWIICGLFETWIIGDYLCLDYLWIICFRLFEIICELFVDYLKHSLFELICFWII